MKHGTTRVLTVMTVVIVSLTLVGLSTRPLRAQNGSEVMETQGILNIDGGVYTGECHDVKTTHGTVTMACRLQLQSGTPVAHKTEISYEGTNVPGWTPPTLPCNGVLTSDGRAKVTCHFPGGDRDD